MNLIEKWKSRETKRKLKEENIQLKTEIEMLHKIPKPPVCTIERNVQKIQSNFSVRNSDPIPTEVIKDAIVRELMCHIKNFVDYDFYDTNYGERVYFGSIFVATGDRKYEHN